MSTAHTIELARAAERAGVHGLLVVTPYYNKPPQAALEAHFTRSPTRPGCPCSSTTSPAAPPRPSTRETLIRLAAHPRIIGVKDAKDTPGATSHVLARTDLVYYCGTDMLNLPWLSLGAVGFISVVGHVVGDRLREMIDAFGAGDVIRARQIHYELVPVYIGMFRNQGAVMTKAALDLLGQPGGAVRAPLLTATAAERHQLTLDLTAGDVKLPGTASQATVRPGTGA